MQEHVITFKDGTDYRQDLRELIGVIGLRSYNAMAAMQTGKLTLALHEGEIPIVKKLNFVESVKVL